MDANYYHYPGSWIGSRPGFLNGGGFPMRFADTDGTIVDVYQQNTNMNDEAGQAYPATINALLDNAVGANGYYGAFGVNIHTDNAAPNTNSEAIVTSAQARGRPDRLVPAAARVDGRPQHARRSVTSRGATGRSRS